MRSSTSNSERSWARFRRLGWGLLIAALILGALEVYVFRNPYVYDLGKAGRGGFIGQWAYLDRAFEAADPEAIEYAVFGDSQSIDALRPDVIAEVLGVPAGRIFNFSVTGGKPTDNAYTYRRYAERMPNLKQVVYVVNEHQLNNADAAADSKFRFHARLVDRLRALDSDNYGELLTGWALRSFGMRTEWTDLIKRYREGKWPAADRTAYPGGIEPLVWADPKTKTEDYAGEVADRWMLDWMPSGAYTEAFAALLADMRDRGIAVNVLQIPRTAWFEAAMAGRYAAEQAEYFDLVRRASEEAGAAFAVVTAEEAGLTVDDFRDANHVNPDGAAKLSRYVAERWWKE